jgi:hypothetical protein
MSRQFSASASQNNFQYIQEQETFFADRRESGGGFVS